MMSSKKKVRKFQQQVGFILSDISEPSVNDKLELLMGSMNAGEDSDLPFRVEEGTVDKPENKCLQKLNELYSNWKENGRDEKQLQSVIRKEIYLCVYKYLGMSDEQMNNFSAFYDQLISQEDIKKQKEEKKYSSI